MNGRAVLPALAGIALVAMVLLSARPGPAAPLPPLPDGERERLLGGLGGLDRVPLPATLVVAAPTRPYEAEEVAALRAFLDRGGRALVADPTPAAAGLLHALDIGLEASQATVFDPDVDAQGQWVAHGTGALDLPDDVALSSSRILEGGGEAVVVTGSFAWRDVDADGEPDLGEPRGSWVLAARQSVGHGEVLVLGTSDLLRGAAGPAVQAWLDDGGVLVVDDGHRMAPDALDVRPLLAGHRPLPVAIALAAVMAVGALVAFRVRAERVRPSRRRGPVDRQTLELLAELGD